MWRICNVCGLRTNDRLCADDNTRTELITAATQFPGRLQTGYLLRDQYRVDTLIGVGGMGAVYKAVHHITEQPVAIKVLWRDLANSRQEVRRFTREARAASVLTHPNTVRVFDFGKDEPTASIYMIMEYLEGQKLSDVLADTPVLAPSRIVTIVTQVCKALEEAHTKGIVHRDLKPDNVFLQEVAGERDFVKVLDFGLAKFIEGERERESLTKVGYVVGSPEYMAPEQAIGTEGITPAADIYSLGIMMYEMVTGDLPFNSSNTTQLLRDQIMARVPEFPLEIRGSIPPRLEALIHRCLSKEANDRPSSMGLLRIQILQAYDRRRQNSSVEKVSKVSLGDAHGNTIESPTQGVEAPGALAGWKITADGGGADMTPRKEDESLANTLPVDTDRVARARRQGASGGDDLIDEVLSAIPDARSRASVSEMLAADDEPPPLSGWTLVAIGFATAMTVLLAAYLLK